MSHRVMIEQKRQPGWFRLSKSQKEIILYLLNASVPVSLDDLLSLSNRSAVNLLNVIEKLRQSDIICEKTETGKGIYFLKGNFTRSLELDDEMERENQRIIQKMLSFYSRTLRNGNQKNLILAELYRKLDGGFEGAQYIKNAAVYMARSGQVEKAADLFEYLSRKTETVGIDENTADIYLDSILGRIFISSHLLPINEQITLLTRANNVAKQYKQWDALSKIKLALGQKLQAAGDKAKAYANISEFQRLAEESGNPKMLKTATLLLSEYLHWKGRFSEVVRRYEEVVEELEEFGDDEATLKASARVGLCYVRTGKISRGIGMIEAVRVKAKLLNLDQVTVFTDFMMMISLFEIRKLDEAEKMIERLLARPQEEVGHFILSPVNSCTAYILTGKKEYRKAYQYMHQAVDHVKVVGWEHQNGAWNFESMDELEANGFVHPTWNYNSEITRLLKWDDIYMKGVAYRFRALQRIRQGMPFGKIVSDLKNSEKYLADAGAELELARTHIVFGNILNEQGDSEGAHVYLEKAWSVLSKVDRDLFPKDLLYVMPQEQKTEMIIDRMIEANESLGKVKELKEYLEKVTGIAMNFMNAMRGAFVELNAVNKQVIITSRNLDPLLIRMEQSNIIHSLVELSSRKMSEIIYPGSEEIADWHTSALKKSGIHSAICMPVKLDNTILGFLYLDNCLGKEPFNPNHLPFLRLICSQTAIGLSNIKIYDEIKETKNRFEQEAIHYKSEMGITNPHDLIIGQSPGIKRVMDEIKQVAGTDISVLVLGETGVGKELVAKAIHNMSHRSEGPYITVNLAAIPADLVASELFGHEKGAFTGATEAKKGRFELAHDGTILLDEIGDLPIEIQVKILRVLQEGVFERLGNAKVISSNFRVVAATNKDLHAEVGKGHFRQDLFFRLNAFPIFVPPLRERKEDIPALVEYFVERFSRQVGKTVKRIPRSELNKLMAYHWPGNIRELKHLVQRSVILLNGSELKISGFDYTTAGKMGSGVLTARTLEEHEREYIRQVLDSVFWKISGPGSASEILGLNPSTLRFRMKKLNISKPA